jgi:uncharacterized protein
MIKIKKKDWDKLNNRIFLLPTTEDNFIMYAPLADFAALVSSGVARMIKTYILAAGEYRIPSQVALALGNLRFLEDSVSANPENGKNNKFLPAMVTLFPTNRCNLDCAYCYANAGKNPQSLKMTLPIARAAIRFCVHNAQKTGEKQMRLGFHGGGEPLLERDFVASCIDYAKRLCDDQKLDLRLVAATNGCLSELTIDWIADTFDSLSLSCDGPDFIQDSQRPFPNGLGSWQTLSRNVQKLQHRKVQFGVRVTLTSESIAFASDIVRFFVEQWNVYNIHFEPLYKKGRGKDSKFHSPSSEEFIQAFKEAYHTSQQLGARLQYSGTRLSEIHSSFCEVDGQSFSVTPDGYATACFEVTDGSKEGADLFLYGKYDHKKDQFVFDKKKLSALRNLNLETKEFCKDCFCRWNCAGDCPAKCPQLNETGIKGHIEGPGARCDINRAITQFLLEEKLTSVKPRVSA